MIVACDGCTDATAARARAAGADLVLELPRGGKIRAQDAAVERARGEIVAFSDANALWEPDAARALVGAFADPRVGYACGQVRFVQAAAARTPATRRASTGATSWPCARSSRACPRSRPATARSTPPAATPTSSSTRSWATTSRCPFNMVKRGLRAVYVPGARASEKMVPSLAGEFARKRRMMSHTWPIVLRGGMLSPRGYPPGYALMIFSHRAAALPARRSCTLLALAANVALRRRSAPGRCTRSRSRCSSRCCSAPLLAGALRARPLLIARYYVLTTASPAAGLWDWLRHGTAACVGGGGGHALSAAVRA